MARFSYMQIVLSVESAPENGIAAPVHGDFIQIYTAFAPAIYGIVLRIAKDESISRYILKEIFIAFYQQGWLIANAPLRLCTMLPLIYKCITQSLSGILSEMEIKNRISEASKTFLSRKEPLA